MRTTAHRSCKAFTLLEMIVVVAVLAVLAGMVVPMLTGVSDDAQRDSLNANLSDIRNAIMGKPDVPGYVTDTRETPAKLANLFVNPYAGPTPGPADPLHTWNPNTRLGWRGPYLLNSTGRYADVLPPATSPTWINPWGSDYGAARDPAMIDPWGNAIVLQPTANPQYARLISAGRNGVIETDPADLTALTRGDDFVLFLRRPDVP